MDDNITDFPLRTYGKEVPDRLLKAFNADNDTEEVVIVGLDKEGYVSISSSYGDIYAAIGLLEHAKMSMLAATEEEYI